jgi:hypothetical protein
VGHNYYTTFKIYKTIYTEHHSWEFIKISQEEMADKGQILFPEIIIVIFKMHYNKSEAENYFSKQYWNWNILQSL